MLSLVLAFMTLLFATYMSFIMFERLDTTFSQNTITNYYSEKDIIYSVEKTNVTDAKGTV